MNKKADIVRGYLPPDANTLLSVADHCLLSEHYVNVMVIGKRPDWQRLDMDSVIAHCTAGLGVWNSSSSTRLGPWCRCETGGNGVRSNVLTGVFNGTALVGPTAACLAAT